MDGEILQQLKKEFGINVKKVEKIEENEIFKILSDKLEEFLNRSPLKSLIRFESMEMNSLVESKRNYYTLKQHPSITMILPDGSHLRFSPDMHNGIEITRVSINEENRRNGLGTALMKAFQSLCYYALGNLPNMTLECTGAIGIGDNFKSTPINGQIKFFESFGFKVKKRNKGGYVLMEFKGESSDEQNINDSI